MTSGIGLLDAGLPMPAVGVFTTRAGGTSRPPWSATNLALHTGDDWDRVNANRDLLARQLGLTARDLIFGRQVHGVGVRLVERATSSEMGGGLRDTDGLVTTRPGTALVMMGADCPPVLLADPHAGVVGAAHVGRPGLAAGVLREVLRVMAEQGAEPARTTAVIGPGVCGLCYEVPSEMADDVARRAPGSRGTTRQGTASVDLVAGATRQLEDAGIATISSLGGCTVEQPDLFFSYRRDGVTGRHGGVVLLR